MWCDLIGRRVEPIADKPGTPGYTNVQDIFLRKHVRILTSSANLRLTSESALNFIAATIQCSGIGSQLPLCSLDAVSDEGSASMRHPFHRCHPPQQNHQLNVAGDSLSSCLFDERPVYNSGHFNAPVETDFKRMRRRKDCPITRACVFCPNGQFLYFWSGLISSLCLYNMWAISFRFAFDEINMTTILYWFPIDYTADFFYILDIFVGFRTAFLENGIVQKDPRKTRQHYVNSSLFYIDCLCLLPLDFLYLSLGFHSLVRVFRIVKMYKFWEFIERFDRQTSWYSTILNSAWKWIVFNLTWLHWNACIYRCVMDTLDFAEVPIFAFPDNNTNGTKLHHLTPTYYAEMDD